MIGVVYKAIDTLTGCVVKIGSTIKTLKRRSADKCYNDCLLIPIRTDEYEDSDFGTLHLRIRETQEITKNQTWHEMGYGGRNILNPIRVWISGVDIQELRSFAGKKGGLKTFELHGNPGTKEGSTLGGTVTGEKNVKSGWAKELGKTYGGRVCSHLADFRTTEHQISAGKKGGEAASIVNDKSGWSKKLGSIYGPENGRKIPQEARRRGSRRATHNRWHVRRNIISDSCSLCCIGEI